MWRRAGRMGIRTENDVASRFIRRISTAPRSTVVLASSAILFVVAVALGEASYWFVISPNVNAVFWLPSGLVFGLFIAARRAPWLWPGWLIATGGGQLAITSYHGLPLTVALAWTVANMVLPLCGVLLSRRLDRDRLSLGRISDILALTAIVAVSVVPGALVAAGASAVWLGTSFGAVALSWGTSDALAIILLTPVVLTWSSPQLKPAGQRLEAAVLFAALAIFCWFVFHLLLPSPFDASLPSLLFLFVAWASIRFGPRATALATLVIDIALVEATIRGRGPLGWSTFSAIDQLRNLQILVAVVSMLTLLLAAAIGEQRAARAAAEKANRVRDEFLNIASHELHTPLTALRLSVQLLLSGAKHPPEAETTLLGVIDRQVKKLAFQVDELLDSTRIAEGRVHLALEKIDLAALAREVAERTAGLAARTGSHLSVRADAPVWGCWDRLRLEQILTNLLSNATKFGAGKPIELAVDVTGDEQARVVVTDQGIGIAPARLPHIFERFEQAVEERHYGGLGLGLYIVRSFVQLLGGTVDAVSAPGAGATFTVLLPLRPEVRSPS